MTAAHTQPLFQALADPTRRWLIERLAQVDSDTVSNLARQRPVTRQAISKHFAILMEADLVSSRQVGRERQYSLNPEGLNEANYWIESITSQWDRRLQRLQDYLSEE